MAMIQIFVNDDPEQTQPATLNQWMEKRGLSEKKGIALALNDEMVPRTLWAATRLQEGDRVLLIQATQGG